MTSGAVQRAAAEAALRIRPRRTLLQWLGWFWLFVATITVLIGLRYAAVAPVPAEAGAATFFAVLTLGHWYVLYFLLAAMVFFPLAILLPHRRLITYLAITVATLCLIALVVDVFVFNLFRFHLNGLVFSLLLSDAADEIFVFSPMVYATTALIIVVLVAVTLLAARLAWRMVGRQTAQRLGLTLGLALFVAFLLQNIWFAWASAAGVVNITTQAGIYPLYFPARADSFFYENGIVEPGSKQSLALQAQGTTGRVHYPRQELHCAAPQPLPNIFWIVIDSWRSDALGAEVTPRIHEFAQQASMFSKHYSGGNNTRTGLFSLFYGLPATYWESFLDARQGAPFVRALLDHDYDLAIYASAKLTGPEFDKTIFAEVADLRKSTNAKSVYGRDELSTEEFIAHITHSDKRPVFGFLFYDAPHSYVAAETFRNHFKPAAPGINYYSLTKDTDPEPILNLYRNSVISVDYLVGNALDAIRAAGMWDDSIIVITGDHAQEFNDNGLGYWGHNGNFTDAQLQVPLLVKWPGKEPQTVAYTTTHFDITASMMTEIFGCQNPIADYGLGTPLFTSGERSGFVVGGFGDFAVRLADRIYWVDKYGGIQVMSADNRVLPEKPDPVLLAKAMRQITDYLR